jgi:hypothetical protein
MVGQLYPEGTGFVLRLLARPRGVVWLEPPRKHHLQQFACWVTSLPARTARLLRAQELFTVT